MVVRETSMSVLRSAIRDPFQTNNRGVASGSGQRGDMRDGACRVASHVDVMMRLAGKFSVERDGKQLVGTEISGKARTLLALLTAERERVVPIHRIEEVLWEGSAPKQPANNVATLVSRLRKILGHHAITGGRDGYRLGQVRVDIDEAAALIGEAENRLAADQPAPAGIAAN